ncbi:MAG: Si-specific NAD(P)(+) transhydrogenase [Nitrospira sp. LK265]|nr:Si-specific NAD(P)(+) transhydrogenase [Nitrospira sp.]NGZ60122.1 Si-specific NAD(P)(+) transhydrogenase [Nitrospira sp. LK265]
MARKKYDFDMVCIGSGPAGQRASIQAAKLGKRVAVIERRRILGGVCVETGTIPSKTFREAVLSFLCAAHHVEQHLGNHFDSRPTAEQLLARVADVTKREVEVVADQLRRNDVVLIQGEASFKDAHTMAVAGEQESRIVSAANILIATGTIPAQPDGVPVDGEVILTSDDITSIKKLPRKMVVVGGGIIGVEYASMLAALKINVTLVDKRTGLLEFLDSEIVEELMHQMRNRNVTFRLGEAVEKLELTDEEPRRAILTLESGKRIMAESVLYSVGRMGAVERLNLAAAGLSADKRGRLTVDPQFRTEIRHIFAAGDIIGYPSLASTSASQGRHVACHAFGVEIDPVPDHPPVGIYAIPEISMTGPPEQVLTDQHVPYETGIARYREIARGQILGDDSGLVKLLFHREDRRLLAVHAIGTGATELTHIGQAVLDLGGGLEYFLRTIFNYPTLAECYKVAALDAHNKLAMTASHLPKEAT